MTTAEQLRKQAEAEAEKLFPYPTKPFSSDYIKNVVADGDIDDRRAIYVKGRVDGYTQALQEQQGWISVEERLPEFLLGKDYSDNVFAVVDGRLEIMCLVYEGGDWNEGSGGIGWAKCYNGVDGDCEWDDNYNVTLWQPFPALPSPPTH